MMFVQYICSYAVFYLTTFSMRVVVSALSCSSVRHTVQLGTCKCCSPLCTTVQQPTNLGNLWWPLFQLDILPAMWGCLDYGQLDRHENLLSGWFGGRHQGIHGSPSGDINSSEEEMKNKSLPPDFTL